MATGRLKKCVTMCTKAGTKYASAGEGHQEHDDCEHGKEPEGIC